MIEIGTVMNGIIEIERFFRKRMITKATKNIAIIRVNITSPSASFTNKDVSQLL